MLSSNTEVEPNYVPYFGSKLSKDYVAGAGESCGKRSFSKKSRKLWKGNGECISERYDENVLKFFGDMCRKGGMRRADSELVKEFVNSQYIVAGFVPRLEDYVEKGNFIH